MIIRSLLTLTLIAAAMCPSKLVVLRAPDTSKIEAEYACMVKALHFESRGESTAGIHAVANVILNRVKNSKFPKTVCDVVYQKNNSVCQFSWNCDGQPDDLVISRVDKRILKIAYSAVIAKNLKDITSGSLFFHNDEFAGWEGLNRTVQIGNHHFYSY